MYSCAGRQETCAFSFWPSTYPAASAKLVLFLPPAIARGCTCKLTMVMTTTATTLRSRARDPVGFLWLPAC